ncbi:MAG: hypothetical protein FAZ92_00603 [Accumulibacter sp.]|nr:MAG: hypothetical protein FAZ92_00603 [Accumulibacter sp.]
MQQHRNQVPPYPETMSYVQLVTQFHQLYQDNTLTRKAATPSIFTRSAAGGQRIYMKLPGRRDVPETAPAR